MASLFVISRLEKGMETKRAICADNPREVSTHVSETRKTSCGVRCLFLTWAPALQLAFLLMHRLAVAISFFGSSSFRQRPGDNCSTRPRGCNSQQRGGDSNGDRGASESEGCEDGGELFSARHPRAPPCSAGFPYGQGNRRWRSSQRLRVHAKDLSQRRPISL